MARNRIHAPQNNLTVPVSTLVGGTGGSGAVQSGDPLLFGDDAVPCVALSDVDADNEATVQFGTALVVYEIAVAGTVAAGDAVYHAGAGAGGTATATDNDRFGIALTGATDGTVRVAVGI